MWCYRRRLRISGIERKTNIEILQKFGKEYEVINTIKSRKLQSLGHIMRGQRYEMLKLIMQGKIKERRNVGRRKISLLRNLRDWYNCSSIELFRAAANKVKIAMRVSNLR